MMLLFDHVMFAVESLCCLGYGISLNVSKVKPDIESCLSDNGWQEALHTVTVNRTQTKQRHTKNSF